MVTCNHRLSVVCCRWTSLPVPNMLLCQSRHIQTEATHADSHRGKALCLWHLQCQVCPSLSGYLLDWGWLCFFPSQLAVTGTVQGQCGRDVGLRQSVCQFSKPKIQTQKGPNRCLFIVTWTDSMQTNLGKSSLSSHKMTFKQQINGQKWWKMEEKDLFSFYSLFDA